LWIVEINKNFKRKYMGCHTWYRKPLVKGKENVQKYLREHIDIMRKKDYWNDECEQEAILSLKAIDVLDENMDEELEEYLNLDDRLKFINGEPIIFVSANGYETDEPRIGGYPDTIIKSADEMFKVMESGLVNWEGKHFSFCWDKDREDYIRKNIVDFFNQHPDGIIEFG
jgi:hypothetical protein